MPMARLAEGIKLVSEVRLEVGYPLWRILVKVRPNVRGEELVAGCSKFLLDTALACSKRAS